MVGFVDDFLDMMSDEVIVTPGYSDGYGEWISSGEVLTIPCRIEGQIRQVPGPAGHTVVSSMQLILGGYFNLTTRNHRYTIPARYAPRLLLGAVGIEKETDEDGPCYEVILLP